MNESTRQHEKTATRLTTAAVEAVSQDQDFLSASHGLTKVNSHQSHLAVPPQRTRSRSPDTLSLVSADDLPELRLNLTNSRTGPEPLRFDWGSEKPQSKTARWKRATKQSWIRNKGLALVLISQIFGTLMNITTRLLENGNENEPGMDPFQILFARMSLTFILAMAYMAYTKVEHWPLGPPGVRLLLVCRGVGGFFGVFGLYWSLQYLPLADATVLSFLGPPLACYVCSKILKEPFTRIEQIAALISLGGVVLIAKPSAFFKSSDANENETNANARRSDSIPEATPHQRLAAVGMAMVGVLGAAIAYTTIRWIGKRAHPLISVNYFALWCTIVSTFALAFVPSVPFILPSTLRQWSLLIFIGVSGFFLQFLLTAGLAYEKSSRANNMVYTQIIFALGADLAIWGHVPGLLSMAGSALILGSAVVVAVQKEKGVVQEPVAESRLEEQERLMHNAGQMEDGVARDEVLEMQGVASAEERARATER